jgi:hypothetical protein
MNAQDSNTAPSGYISQADSDCDFGIEVLKQYFPDAQVVTTAPTPKKVQVSAMGRLPEPLQSFSANGSAANETHTNKMGNAAVSSSVSLL